MDAKSLAIWSTCIGMLSAPWTTACYAGAVSAYMPVGIVIRDVCTVTGGAANLPVVVSCANPSTTARISTSAESDTATSDVATSTSIDGIVTISF
ncbi:hypothetical protein AAHK20_32080 [Trinickia sp. YCB016]